MAGGVAMVSLRPTTLAVSCPVVSRPGLKKEQLASVVSNAIMNSCGVVVEKSKLRCRGGSRICRVEASTNGGPQAYGYDTITIDAGVGAALHAQDKGVLQFVKYHGLGNDFLLVDNRDSETPKITPEQAVAVCDRNFGVGGDGVIFVLPGTNGSDYTMRIYNSDGSEPEMCGNGIRCMARFVAELEGTTESRSYNISTLGGLIVPRLQDDGQVCVDMGPPILEAGKIPTTLSPSKDGAVVKVPLSVNGKFWSVTCVSMGNPHCVTILDDAEVLDDLPLSSIGPLFEHHEVFPARTNTEFIQVLSPSHIRMRVWERGAGATLACGTGACALVVAAVLEGRTERKCLVELPGGPLQIEWREYDNRLYMTGPAQKVFAGTAFL